MSKIYNLIILGNGKYSLHDSEMMPLSNGLAPINRVSGILNLDGDAKTIFLMYPDEKEGWVVNKNNILHTKANEKFKWELL